MALSAAAMVVFIQAAMVSAGFTETAQMTTFLTPLCQGIIDEINTNAATNSGGPGAHTHTIL